jgi:Na+-transporting NADH:ubiquinone oxidoreductase subunit NqrF
MLRDHVGDDLESLWYMVAGPPVMVEAIVETLGTVGIPEDQIHAGRFSGY